MAGRANPLLVVLATLGLILLGLVLNLGTALFPLLLWVLWRPDDPSGYYYLGPILVVQFWHLRYLWIDKDHLASYRFLTAPLRRLLFPVVMFVVKADAIKDHEDTMYLSLDKVRSANDLPALLSGFSPSVRRRYRKVFAQSFGPAGIRVATVPAERALHLQEVVPLIWLHQKRMVGGTAKVAEDFIKRFLVMVVVPDGVLDLFYQDDTLVAVQMGVLQGNTYHWFMYFSREEARQCGIWFYGTLLSIQRAKLLEGQGVTYVNAHIHHVQSKRNAGYDVASYENSALLDDLYPWAFARRLTQEALSVSLLDANGPTTLPDN